MSVDEGLVPQTVVLLRFEFLQTLELYLQRLRQGTFGLWAVAIELLLIGAIVYAALRFLQGTRGERLLKSFWLILFTSFLIVRLIAEKLELDRLIFLYPYFVSGVVLTTLIAFQPEIRRGLILMGETRWLRSLSKETARVIDPIVTAVSHLSQKKIGALIAVERDVGVEAIVEGGVRLDAKLSAELLETIFWPGSILHDLGVVIRRSRIAAAACQFPIAESGEVALALGSRHRAAVGLSHDCDAVVIVVSEETGSISVAQSGKLRRGLTIDELRRLLVSAFAETNRDKKPTHAPAGRNETVNPIDDDLLLTGDQPQVVKDAKVKA
ncbi:MAG: diadenylate cyclase CdaA [Phycisphaerae bacterium]